MKHRILPWFLVFFSIVEVTFAATSFHEIPTGFYLYANPNDVVDPTGANPGTNTLSLLLPTVPKGTLLYTFNNATHGWEVAALFGGQLQGRGFLIFR